MQTASSDKAKLVKESDVEAVDQAHHDELDRLIERRAQGRTGRDAANERERLLKEGVERHHARRRKENRAAWYEHFCRQAEAHRKLSEDYGRRAHALQEGGS